MNCINKFFILLKFCLLALFFLYFYRVFSYSFGRNTFFLLKIEKYNYDLITIRNIRIIYQYLLDVLFILVVFKFKNQSTNSGHLNELLLFLPILTDLSDIIFDKSCWKPWININEFMWYFPLRFTIWLLVFKMSDLKYFKLSIVVTLIIDVLFFTLIKPY